MGVDSRDKRMSVIGLALSFPTVLPNPGGLMGVAFKYMYLKLYYSVLKNTTTLDTSTSSKFRWRSLKDYRKRR